MEADILLSGEPMEDAAASESRASYHSSEGGQLSLCLQPLSDPQRTHNQALS